MEIPTIENSLLTVIDLQQKLVPAMSGAEALIDRSTLLIRGCAALGMDMILTEQYPKGLGSTLMEISTWVPDSVKVIEKTSFSAFGTPEYVAALNAHTHKTLIFAGVETHVCVLQSALDARQAGHQVIVVSDAVASRKESDRDTALALMRQAGIAPMSAEALLFMLLRTSRHPAFKTVSALVK